MAANVPEDVTKADTKIGIDVITINNIAVVKHNGTCADNTNLDVIAATIGNKTLVKRDKDVIHGTNSKNGLVISYASITKNNITGVEGTKPNCNPHTNLVPIFIGDHETLPETTDGAGAISDGVTGTINVVGSKRAVDAINGATENNAADNNYLGD